MLILIRAMGTARKSKHDIAEDIVGRLARRHSTAIVLFHHALGESLGLGPTDHKCLDVIRERGPMTGSELAAITGLTTGAITGVVARLERTGYLRRRADQRDGRKQILDLALKQSPIHDAIGPLRQDVAALLEKFDAQQLTAVAEFLAGSTELIYRHATLLRAHTLYGTAQATRKEIIQR